MQVPFRLFATLRMAGRWSSLYTDAFKLHRKGCIEAGFVSTR